MRYRNPVKRVSPTQDESKMYKGKSHKGHKERRLFDLNNPLSGRFSTDQ